MRTLTWLAIPVVLLCGLGAWLLAGQGALGSPPSAQAANAPLLTPTATATPGQICGSGTWTTKAALPISLGDNAVAAQGGLIYSFGGYRSGPGNAAYKYNPDADTWTSIALLPAYRWRASAVSDGTYLYILNGYDSGYMNTLYRYDPVADSYTTLAPAPLASTDQAAVYLDGKIYRIGGYTNPTQTASVDVYTIATDTWAPPGTVADYPQALGALVAVAANGYIYAGGGANQNTPSTKTYRYDPASNTWDDAAVPDLPQGHAVGASDILDGRWIVAGGYAWDYQVDQNVIALSLSNPVAGWTGLAWEPAWRWGVQGATVGGTFYTVGGFDQAANAQADTEAFHDTFCAPTPTGTPATPTRTGTVTATRTPPSCGGSAWILQRSVPVPEAAGGAAAQGGYLYVFGGYSNGAPIANAERYSPGADYWTAIRPLPVALSGPSAVSDGTYLYIVNGGDLSNQVRHDFYRYDPATDSYTSLAPAPVATWGQALVYLNGKIYRIAGSTAAFRTASPATSEMDVYTIATDTWAPGAAYPLSGGHPAAVASDGYIYAAGNAGGYTQTFRYDPATNTWDDLAVTDLPQPMDEAGTGVLNNQWILAGGSLTSGAAAALDLGFPTGPWSTLPSEPLVRGAPASGVVGNAFYAAGGIANVTPIAGTQDNQRLVLGLCAFSPTPIPTATPLPPTATITATPPAATPTPPPCGAGAWATRSLYPTPVLASASVAQGGILYNFGGANGNVALASAYKYDPGTDTWSALHDLPAGRYGASAVSDGSFIYIQGGWDGSGPVNTMWRYDPAQDSYLTLAAAPTSVGGPGLAYLNGKIYRIAGCTTSNAVCESGTNALAVYTIASNSWSIAANYPLALGFVTALPLGNYIYTAGGSTSLTGTTKTYRYDPSVDTWDDAVIADLPWASNHSVGGWLNGRWIISGGTPLGGGGYATAWNPASNTWTLITFPPLGRDVAAGGSTGQAFYMVGGALDANYNSATDVQQYTEVPCPTETPGPATGTPTPPPSNTPGTPTATSPPAPTNTPGPSATPCTVSFSDVHLADYFYTPVRYLACRSVISGYGDGTFRPYADTTRSQMVKIVVLGFAAPINTPASGYTFADVPRTFPFFTYVETAAAGNIVSGYTCGGSGEPCDSENRPYFRPYANVTRGQLSKIDVLTAGWTLVNPPVATFADVRVGPPFYQFVETAAGHGVVSGYACGGVGEPCDPQNRPYFRQYNFATRGQIAKIVYLSATGTRRVGWLGLGPPGRR